MKDGMLVTIKDIEIQISIRHFANGKCLCSWGVKPLHYQISNNLINRYTMNMPKSPNCINILLCLRLRMSLKTKWFEMTKAGIKTKLQGNKRLLG